MDCWLQRLMLQAGRCWRTHTSAATSSAPSPSPNPLRATSAARSQLRQQPRQQRAQRPPHQHRHRHQRRQRRPSHHRRRAQPLRRQPQALLQLPQQQQGRRCLLAAWIALPAGAACCATLCRRGGRLTSWAEGEACLLLLLRLTWQPASWPCQLLLPLSLSARLLGAAAGCPTPPGPATEESSEPSPSSTCSSTGNAWGRSWPAASP